MLTTTPPQRNEPRALLSLRETTVLAKVPEPRVRKDIETGILLPIRAKKSERPLFRWADVFLFAAVYSSNLLSSQLRRKAFEKFESLIQPTSRREYYSLLDAHRLATAKCEWGRPS